ncbi:MAG: M20/M25/M40 family metallo-hydrolase [Planctomycetota bacterium]
MRRLTRELIAIDSVTGSEAAVAEYLAGELGRRGWKVRLSEAAPGRPNLLAVFEEGSPRILFNTHLDTVPEAYGPEEDEERIYGRGACDTKGILAAMLEALEDARQTGAQGLGLLLVAGEERDHVGALAAGKDPGLDAPEILVVGEPTRNRFLTAQKGLLSGRLEARGREGHSGYPEEFDSAVEKLVVALEALRTAPFLVRRSEEGTTVNLSLLQGGDAFNKVASSASAMVLFRLAKPAAELIPKVEALLGRLSPEVRICWEIAGACDPIPEIDALEGFPTGVAAFGTDLSFFGWNPRRRYLFGPGSILQAHRDPVPGDPQAGEWILKREQEEGARLYRELLRREAEP